MPAILLALVLAASSGAAPVAIYVGPIVKNGFVDVDTGIEDSIKDIQAELRKVKGVRVVPTEAEALLTLYVTGRKKEAGPPIAFGSAINGTGTAGSVPADVRTLETLLRVGSYERAFSAEDHMYYSWRKCAESIAKDVAVWLDKNRERVLTKP